MPGRMTRRSLVAGVSVATVAAGFTLGASLAAQGDDATAASKAAVGLTATEEHRTVTITAAAPSAPALPDMRQEPKKPKAKTASGGTTTGSGGTTTSSGGTTTTSSPPTTTTKAPTTTAPTTTTKTPTTSSGGSGGSVSPDPQE